MKINYQTHLGRIIDTIYQLVSPLEAGNARLSVLRELKESGSLANMCSSEVHQYFGITREA